MSGERRPGLRLPDSRGGGLARLQGIAGGYVAGGLATVLALPVLWALRRQGDRQDRLTTP